MFCQWKPEKFKREQIHIPIIPEEHIRRWRVERRSYWFSDKSGSWNAIYLCRWFGAEYWVYSQDILGKHSVSSFYSTYLCETGFSSLLSKKTKSKNCLNPSTDPWIAVNKKILGFDKIISKRQGQRRHWFFRSCVWFVLQFFF